MVQKKQIPHRFPSLNDYIEKERIHRQVAAKMKKEWTELAQLYFNNLKPFTTPVSIKFTWTEPNAKRDPDNIIFAKKFILDGIVKAGVLPNDNQRWIKSITDVWLVDENNVGVEVIMEEV